MVSPSTPIPGSASLVTASPRCGLIFLDRYVQGVCEERRAGIVLAGTPSRGASLRAVPAGSLTSRGCAYTVRACAERARSSPLRSKIRPRSDGSSMVRRRCLAAASSSDGASTTWSITRRLEMARNAASVSASTTSSRRELSPRRGPSCRRGAGRRATGRPEGARADRALAVPLAALEPRACVERCALCAVPRPAGAPRCCPCCIPSLPRIAGGAATGARPRVRSRLGQVLLERERLLRPRPGVAGGSGPRGGGGSRRPGGGLVARPRAGPPRHPRPPRGHQVPAGGLAGDAVRRLEPVDLSLEAGVAVLRVVAAALEPGDGERLLADADVQRHQAEHPRHHHQTGEHDESQPRRTARRRDRAQAVAGVQTGLVGRARTESGTGGRAHHCPPARSLDGSFSAARSLALSARGLAATSSAPGVSGRRVRIFSRGEGGTGGGGGGGGARGDGAPSRPVAAATKVRLTMRSSSEW